MAPNNKIVPNKFEQFLINRQSLIDQYTKGDLSKEEFIEANYRCINALDIKPFQKIDNVKKAIYNYQYYNVLAKYYQKRAHDLNKRNEAREDFLELANYYYSRKDQTTEKLLKLIDFVGVDAYYVKVKSPNLKKKLFEIVLKDYDNVILHSKNEVLLNLLIKENVFLSEERQSLVDSYINQKY
ncbi:MAG: hypothetical protein N3B21_11825 [Clostridia bacterium]|nr:hypothetical protein [Clostridia bacterium]